MKVFFLILLSLLGWYIILKIGFVQYFILHPINKSLKLREYWFNKEVPNDANKKTMGQQDKSENRHGRASGTQCR